jgi:hypothetical protein
MTSAALQKKSRDKKLAPVDFVDRGHGRKPEPVAVGPYVATTYVSINATCPSSCPMKGAGCYAQAGAAQRLVHRLDAAAAGRTPEDVIADEVRLIDDASKRGVPKDGARGGRDLRLHVGGDVGSEAGARLLAAAARRWRDRGGGTVWTFTHLWREVPREAFGEISVLASVESAQEIGAARQRGYPAAIVVERFGSNKAFSLPGSDVRVIPCPAETAGRTCAECRLCLDRDLLGIGVAIGFEAHGRSRQKVRETLVQLRRGRAA